VGVSRAREKNLFQDGFQEAAEGSCAGTQGHGFPGQPPKGPLGKFQLDAIPAQKRLVLLHEGVSGLCQDAVEGFFGEGLHGSDHREAANELRYQAKLAQVFGLDVGVEIFGFVGGTFLPSEADRLAGEPPGNDLIQPLKRPPTDEEDILGIDRDEALLGVFAAALGAER
jgi:hypothetical protein